jgi:predicted DsbA family dithiol-disulfide isomerase
MADRMGVPIVLPSVSPQPYSRLAFEGFATPQNGVGQQYTERMFRAFFVEQRDIGQPEVLTDVATELGLHAEDFHIALDSVATPEAYQQALHRARQLQITVVPTLLIDGQRLGGMPSAKA